MVPFAKSCLKFNFSGEQFWGRAARAPRSRKRFEALVIWGGDFLGGLHIFLAVSGVRSQASLETYPTTYDLRPKTENFERGRSVGGNREVDRDLGLGFDGFAAFKVRFEVPLADGVLGC